MFVKDADLTCLRQGDILKDIPFPRINSQEVSILGRINIKAEGPIAETLVPLAIPHRGDPNWITAQLPVRFGFCAITSQCCDLEPRFDKIRMHTIALARLIPVPSKISS